MDILFVLAVAIFIGKSCSQILAPSPACYKHGDILKLECTTADRSQAITFLKDTVSQGGCTIGCAPNIAQSGKITTYTLSPFDSSTHSGNWTCSYGLSVSPEVIIAANLCSSGGGSTDLTGEEKGLISFGGVVVAFIIISIILCCILNKRCKYGDVCQDSPLSFIFPPGNERRVNITYNGHIPPPTSEPDKKKVTPYQDGKGTINPTNNSGYKEVTPNQGGHENPTPKIKPVDKKVTPHEVVISNNELNIVKGSLTATPPRSGSKQPLHPLDKGERGNENGEDLPSDVKKYDRSKMTIREGK